MSNVQLITIDGALHIQELDTKSPDTCLPLVALPRLIDEGRLDALTALEGAKLLREYVGLLTEDNLQESIPVLRHFIAMEVLRYAQELHGGAVWQHKGVTMLLTAPLVRTVLAHQIEATLATVDSDISVTDRIFHMNDWQSATGGLSELGRDTVTDLFNCAIDGFIDRGYQLPTVH